MHRLLLASLITLCALSLHAAPPALFTDAFAAGDTKAWTLQPPINALGPIPANGAWKTDGNAFVAAGSAAPWTVQTAGDAKWTDYTVSAKITIRKPAPKADFPIYSCEFDRFLPREDFPKFSGHSGEYRYRYFAGEFDWGSDAALYFRYQDRNACYRVQLSTEYQEMILWHAQGGYLQVVPCKLEAGKTYTLAVQAQGEHIQVLLNGKKTIDYWHSVLPTLQGGIGLAAYNSTVAFQEVKVTPLPATAATAPVHQASFRTCQWRGLRWVFDGNEPIVLLERNPYDPAGPENHNNLMFDMVKLQPGYRPFYNTFMGIIRDGGYTTGLQDYDVDGIQTVGEGTGQLTLTMDQATKDGGKLKTRITDVLTYDRIRGAYKHDVTDLLTFTVEQKVSSLEYTDPLTFNNHAAGRGVKYPWMWSNEQFGVFNADNGKIYRHPISKGLLMGEGWYTDPSPSFWMLYPSRTVCPAWEHIEPKDKTWIIVCHWGHDYHNSVRWEQGRTFKAGEQFTIRYTMTAFAREEADRLYTRSEMNPLHADLEAKQKGNLFMYVPTPYAFPICDPAGTSFEQLQSAREPFTGWHWIGDYSIDNTVGRTDHYSMRLDGPTNVTGTIYHNMLDIYSKKYLCTFWLKTKGLKGTVKMKLWYPWDGDKGLCDTAEFGLSGDTDWQQMSFVTNVFSQHDGTEFILQVNGAGTVWMDDFSVRPVEDGETVTEHRLPPPGNPPVPNPDLLIDLPCTEGDGLSCFDASNHGASARLHGVTWADGGHRPVLHFTGEGTALFIPNLPVTAKTGGIYPNAGLTLEAWVRPTKPGAIIGYMGSPMISLDQADPTHCTVAFSATLPGTKYERLASTQTIPIGQWTHVAATLLPDGTARIYINGKPAGEKKFAGSNITFGAYYPVISIGTHGKFYGSNFVGDMTSLRWWARPATEAEIAADAAKLP